MILKHLTRWLSGEGTPARPSVHFGAFGKHPGWNDHIDDQGLDTDLLIEAKRRIYVEGVGGNIDSGSWSSLPEHEVTEGFRHLFAWSEGGSLLLGRFWSSSDGRGRTAYPLCACAHVRGLGLDWALREVLPRLEQVEGACVNTTAAHEVVAAVDQAREGLVAAAASADPQAPQQPETTAAGQLAARPELGPSFQGLYRILYYIETELDGFLPVGASDATRSRTVDARPRGFRVPRCADSPPEAISVWTRFMSWRLAEGAPVILMIPLRQKHIDVLVGRPETRQLWCLRATEEAMPMTTNAGYTITSDFESRANDLIERARRGETPS